MAEVIHAASVCGICSLVRIHEKQEAAATINIIDAVVVTVSLQPLKKSDSFISR